MAEVKVPVSIRGIHWALATLVGLNVLVLPAGDLAHRAAGLLAAGLVVSRVLLSVRMRVGYFHPAAVLVYGAIWASIFALGVTGFMTRLDAFFGNSAIKQVHAGIAVGLVSLAGVHLAGVGLDAVRNRRKTWMKMISG